VDSFTGVFEARQGGALAMCRRRVTSSGIDFAGAMREPRRDGRPDVLPLSVQVSGHGVNPASTPRAHTSARFAGNVSLLAWNVPACRPASTVSLLL